MVSNGNAHPPHRALKHCVLVSHVVISLDATEDGARRRRSPPAVRFKSLLPPALRSRGCSPAARALAERVHLLGLRTAADVPAQATEIDPFDESRPTVAAC